MGKRAILLAGILVIVLAGGCLEKIKDRQEEGIHNYTIYNYSTPGFEINQTQASAVWEKVKFSDDAKFVTREKNYSVIVFVQSYAQDATEWIVVASSIPKKDEDIKVVIFRLDYQTFGFKRSYYFSYPKGKELTLQQSIAPMEEELKKESTGFQSINESAVALRDGNYIYSYLDSNIANTYLFNWNEIPGNDSGRLIEFLEKQYAVGLPNFGKPANIERIENNRAIRVITGVNTVILRLNDEGTEVNLKIDDGRTNELNARMENGKLNIYGETSIGATTIFNKYAGRTIFYATRAVWIAHTRPIKEVSGRLITPGDEINGTRQLPYIETRIESISSPAYRGTSTIAGLSFTAPDYAPNGSEILLDYRTEMMHTDGSLEFGPEGIKITPEKEQLALERMYLFTWDEIPGKDSGKLIEYLERIYFLLDWLKTAKIEKIDNDRTIRVFDGKNSILLRLNDEKTRIDLRTGIYAPYELFAKMDNNKLRIYDKQTPFEKGNGRLVAYSNLTIKTNPAAAEGDYLITITSRYRGLVAGKTVLSFKIGKGGKKSGGKSMIEGSQNIGYPVDSPPPLNETKKAEATAIAINDPYLKDKRYELTGVSSEYLDLENYSGFFAVVTMDVGDPDYPGEIIRYIIDREEKKILGRNAAPRMALEYFRGEVFDEAKDNFTKRWDAWNFPGLWLGTDTNISTETLLIDQDVLDTNHRVIEKHNLIYTTRLVPLQYQAYAHANLTPKGTDGSYPAIGWQGEKYILLDGNRLARIIFEQDASDIKNITTGYLWVFGDGYRLLARSIEAPLEREAWIEFLNNSNKLDEVVLPDRYLYSYPANTNSIPIFITYISSIRRGPYEETGEFKYTWLRSQYITEIKEGDTFGIMEVTSADNGKIELRNKESIDLAHGSVINLMGNLSTQRRNISIQVGDSSNNLSFYPFKVKKQ